jgi:hypothetical protein
MRWEAVALALLTQTLQVGLKSRPEPFVLQPSLPPDLKTESHCHCACICNTADLGAASLAGSLFGGCAISGLWWCCSCRKREPSPSPSHRRRGHGVVSQPYPWSGAGGLL